MRRIFQRVRAGWIPGCVFLAFFAGILVSPAGTSGQSANSKPATTSGMQVVMLGTGTPGADPDRSGPAVAVVVGEAAYLVDCGPGVMRRAAAAQRKGIAALAPGNIHVVFITHLHSDHTLGYPDLIFTGWGGRSAPLEAYGPSGLQSMTDHVEAAWEQDIDVRTNGLEQKNRIGYKVNVHEIEPGVVYKDKNVTVTAFAVAHGSWKQSFGYKFETADRTVVISGDTGPTDAIAKACNHCDVLLHEVYSEASYAAGTPKNQKYSRSFHTSSGELAREATAAKPGLLVLYHQLYYHGDSPDAEMLGEVREHYSGNVVSARDLDVF